MIIKDLQTSHLMRSQRLTTVTRRSCQILYPPDYGRNRSLRAETQLAPGKRISHSSQMIPPTIAPTNQNPEFSSTLRLILVLLEVEVGAVLFVPLGSVPFNTTVLVPLTSPICTNEVFIDCLLPSPMI